MLRTGTVRLAASLVAAFGLAVAAPSAALAATAAVAAPTVSVTPAVDLDDADEVTVSMSGFEGTQPVYAVQCASIANAAVCDWSAAAEVTVDSTGAGTGTLTVRRSYAVDGRTVDCGAVDCAVLATNESGTLRARQGISFRPLG